LIIANNVLYGIIPQGKKLRIFRLRPGDGVFSIVQDIPSLKMWTSGEDAKTTNFSDAEGQLQSGGFAVDGDTFYIEYMRKLLKWTPGSTDAIDTGLTDTDKHIDDDDVLDRGFKIAASAETVYVGKRDGKLFQSIDGGNNWQDVTPNILSSSSQIKDIIFVGSTVYVATDIGVMTSETGEHWSLLTDNIGTSIIIDRFAMEGSSFYGAGDKGVYSLDSRGRWEQILANIPDKVISLSASHDKLYIGTEKLGIFHTSLEEDPPEIKTASVQEAQ
jgi:hypothetical protein